MPPISDPIGVVVRVMDGSNVDSVFIAGIAGKARKRHGHRSRNAQGGRFTQAMMGWPWRLFGSPRPGAPSDVLVHAPQVVANAAPPRPAPKPRKTDSSAVRLSSGDEEFLAGFLAPVDVCPLHERPHDDRLFLEGVRSRWHQRKLELPVLPQSALRLMALLQKGDSSVGKYVELLEQDSALSVEVLTAASSMAYGGGSVVHSVHDAIVRIGMARLEGILLVSQLHSKVLKAGALQHVGRVLVELGGPLSHLASTRARRRGTDAQVALTRGTIWHVEHLVVVGALHDIGRDHQRALRPSMRALHHAFEQFGPEIRLAVAQAWGLEDLLIGGESRDTLRQEYASLRRAIVCRWLARDTTPADAPDISDLADILSDVPSRTG